MQYRSRFTKCVCVAQFTFKIDSLIKNTVNITQQICALLLPSVTALYIASTTIGSTPMYETHQNTSSSGLSGNQLAGPVLGLGHKSPLELFALAGRLLLLLLRVIWGDLRLLATAQEGERAPEEHDQQPGEEGEDARQQEAPPFPVLEAVVYNRGLLGRPFGRHPGGSLLPPGHTFTGGYHNQRQLRRPAGRTLCAS